MHTLEPKTNYGDRDHSLDAVTKHSQQQVGVEGTRINMSHQSHGQVVLENLTDPQTCHSSACSRDSHRRVTQS